jgi:WD40 repeat protein
MTFFITASADKTLRIWHYYDESGTIDTSSMIGIRRNVYCKNLSKIIYVQDKDYSHFKGTSQNNDYQIKCVKVSKDGNYIACGD